MKSAYDYRPNTKQRVIGVLVEKGLTRREILAELLPMVDEQREPMIFRFNEHGTRKPLPLYKQRERLWHSIGRIMAEMGKQVDLKESIPDITAPAPEPAPVKDTSDPETYFKMRLREIRAFVDKRAEIGEPVDELNMRPLVDGIRCIRAGISPDAMLYAMSIHWPEDTRKEAGIRTVDFADECEPIDPIEMDDGSVMRFHRLAGYVLKLALARVPIMIKGPTGTGKSHLAKQMATLLNLRYAECPMTAGASPSWLLGNVQIPTPKNPDGFRPRPCLKCFEEGGVFAYEEMDSSDPNMLLVTNQMLAAEEYHNPADGEMYIRHDDFVPVCTANTWGIGATRQYTGRERLDLATIDRFRMGRIELEFDVDLAERIATEQTCYIAP